MTFRSSSPPAGGGRAVQCIISNMFTVYALYNKNYNKIYIGQTLDLVKRLVEHNTHLFKGYTSRFDGEWIVIFTEDHKTRSEALLREKQLKSYRGRQFIKEHIPE